MDDLIKRIVTFLREQREPVHMQIVYEAIHDHEHMAIDEVLTGLRDRRLVRISLVGDSVELTLAGRNAVEDECILDVFHGEQFIAHRCGLATVHVIVEDDNGEHSGSGFISADYPGRIVTAAHVFANKQVNRIEDQRQNVLSRGPFGTHEVAGIDVGMISCPLPEGLSSLRIEFRENLIVPPEDVIILGYPPFPNHQAALHHSRAQFHAITQQMGREVSSYIISSVVRPGSSGGPVINGRGYAIGVVAQENVREMQGAHPLAYFSATPASLFQTYSCVNKLSVTNFMHKLP